MVLLFKNMPTQQTTPYFHRVEMSKAVIKINPEPNMLDQLQLVNGTLNPNWKKNAENAFYILAQSGINLTKEFQLNPFFGVF